MYYVGETLVGFDRNTCFFNTIDEAVAELNNIISEYVDDKLRRLEIMQKYNLNSDSECWIIRDTTTKKILIQKTLILHKNGNLYIQ